MSLETKKDIRLLSLSQISDYLTSIDEKPFRAKQIYEWIWKKSAVDFNGMSNLSVVLRNKLNEDFYFKQITVADKQISSDKTIKCAFRLFDEKIVEGVLIPTTTRMTACISSQVGCSLSCAFCATGRIDRMRNLDADEIYDQVVVLRNLANEHYGIPLSNIVFMGMGEPLLNYKNVIAAIDKITSPEGLGMSAQRITVSTAGIAKMIKQLADDGVKFNLALSLHAANDDKRSKIMPINDSNSLSALIDALKYFYAKTQIRPTFEYIIFDKFNDEIDDARELAEFCKNVPCKVNIIEYNAIENGSFSKASTEKISAFAKYLESKNIVVNIRRSRGKDIDAACGQLANKNKAVIK